MPPYYVKILIALIDHKPSVVAPGSKWLIQGSKQRKSTASNTTEYACRDYMYVTTLAFIQSNLNRTCLYAVLD